jgi:hypothetical protein
MAHHPSWLVHSGQLEGASTMNAWNIIDIYLGSTSKFKLQLKLKGQSKPTPTNKAFKMAGWYVDRENNFSSYSCPIANHGGYLCTKH